MIEALILIDRDLMIKGYKKAYAKQVLNNSLASCYGWTVFAFFAVAAVDVLLGAAHLIGIHVSIVTLLGIAASIYRYFNWMRKLSASAGDYELDVLLDDDGVTIKNNNNLHIEWDSYAYFKEYEDYLEITSKAGEVSLLPKKDEYARVIIFTKTKIPNKEFLSK